VGWGGVREVPSLAVPSNKRQRQRANAQAGRQYAAQARRRKDTRRRIFVAAVIVAVIIGVAGLVSIGQNDSDDVTTATTTPETTIPTSTTEVEPVAAPVCPPTDGSAPQLRKFSGPFEGCVSSTKDYLATVETDVGTFKVRLDPRKALKAVTNFVALARYHYFDDVTFHRVIPDFVVQGGDPTGTGSGGPGYSFEDELPAATDYKEGSLAMANSGPNTNGSQFFIITSAKGAETLVKAVGGEPKYTLFGQVEEGMDVVKKIEADGDASGTPKVVHKMVKVTVEEVEPKS
jgi:cyclophilin family peptidyl-prolyl cis-trans isomerase